MQNTGRALTKVFAPRQQAQGVGARVKRIIGSHQVRNLDPFLMLDHFKVSKPNGFPDHPHRGFQTVTYMIDGTTLHQDFKGHSGAINTGSIQWMTAGRGIVHAQMPGTDRIQGLQLWVNLSRQYKMCQPDYQQREAEEIVTVQQDGVKAVIIAGEALGGRSLTITRTPATYIDFTGQAGKQIFQSLENGWNGFVYVLEGQIQIEGRKVPLNNAGILENNGNLKVKCVSKSRFVLIAGQPLNEPIVQHGPFVMNTKSQIQQTFMDYSLGMNGFEGARGWRSRIGNQMGV